jgi:SAM-dependent methyltransferase
MVFLALVCLTGSIAGSRGHQVGGFVRTSSGILAPVYGPLAEQIVSEFDLAAKQGIGIDLGSGRGDLIIELCRRTKRMHWINADINPRNFPHFIAMADREGFEDRVSAMQTDAVALPFRDNFADILVSRGSFQFWKDLQKAFAEIYRVLKPGGVAFVGRGFSDNLPGHVAERIRSRQRERGFELTYDVAATASQLESIMQLLDIEDYEIRIPVSKSHKDTRYGIWLEFHKPPEGEKSPTVLGN